MTSDPPPGDTVPDPASRLDRPLYLTLSARPPRLGVLLPLVKDVPWQRTYEMALAAQSPLWGGDANLVFPATDDIHDSELFWTLAERLDADYFVSAAFTHRDVGEADPQCLAEWKAGLEAAMDRDIPDASPEARAGLIERELDEVALEARPDDAFADLLERRLAPFHRRRAARFTRLLAVNERRPRAVIPHEFANVLQIRRSLTQVNNPHTSLGPLEALLLTAHTGRLPSGFEAALMQSTNIIVTPSEVNDRHEWASLIFDPRLAGATAVPRTLNHLGLGWYRQGPWERERVILVTGETSWDFTLYYALLRWRGPAVYWLPQGLTKNTAYTSALVMALRDAGRRAEDDTVTVVTSSDEDFRDKAVAALAEGKWSLFGVPASAGDWRAVLPEEPVRLLDGERPGRAEPVAVHDGATVELPTPIPAAAEEGPNRLRWVTDVRAHGWAPVRHGSLATAVLEQPMFDGDYARTGRNGMAYTSTGAITFGAESLAMSTVRPILHPIALLAQLNAALGADGWSCQGSDKGAYATQSAQLFGGFRPMATALLDPPTRSVIEAFRDPKAPGKRAADRRYLTFADMVAVLGNDVESATDVLDRLTGAGVLTRGLCLKCATCRRGGWYDLSEVTGVFRCRRCRTGQRITRERWLDTIEPPWHYELAEVVHSLLDHDGELPILAVHAAFPPAARPADDIEVAFEVEFFSPDGAKSETDIAVRVRASKLWLGEATKQTYFKESGRDEAGRLQRLSAVADLLSAIGVLLASSTQFRASTRKRAESAFAGHWPVLRLEENVQTGTATEPTS